MLAVYTEITNTIGAGLLQVLAFSLIWSEKMPPEIYKDFAIGIGYVWMVGSALVLGGYGFANVLEKWKPKQ